MTEAEETLRTERLKESLETLMAAVEVAKDQSSGCPAVDISITDGGESYVLTVDTKLVGEFDSLELALERAAEELAARGEST